MAMSVLWTAMIVLSLLFGLYSGHTAALAAAALEGADSAVSLCLSLSGVMCLWSGVMEVMEQSGLSAHLSAAFRPLLKRLLPCVSRDQTTLAAVSANLSANMLGLGSAATSLGIRAAQRMARGSCGAASDELCLFVVLNTASVQLLPTTVAGIRSTLGSPDPFDILGAVWLSSALSVCAGLCAARLFARIWRS